MLFLTRIFCIVLVVAVFWSISSQFFVCAVPHVAQNVEFITTLVHCAECCFISCPCLFLSETCMEINNKMPTTFSYYTNSHYNTLNGRRSVSTSISTFIFPIDIQIWNFNSFINAYRLSQNGKCRISLTNYGRSVIWKRYQSFRM